MAQFAIRSLFTDPNAMCLNHEQFSMKELLIGMSR